MLLTKASYIFGIRNHDYSGLHCIFQSLNMAMANPFTSIIILFQCPCCQRISQPAMFEYQRTIPIIHCTPINIPWHHHCTTILHGVFILIFDVIVVSSFWAPGSYIRRKSLVISYPYLPMICHKMCVYIYI